MSDKLLKPTKDDLLYHLLKSGSIGYWCDEAKVFFGESLSQFKQTGKLDLSKMDDIQAHVVGIFQQKHSDSYWEQNNKHICFNFEILDWIFSNAELSAKFLGKINYGSNWKSLSDLILNYSCPSDFAHHPESLPLTQFRINRLPKTLQAFDNIRAKIKSSHLIDWDRVRHVLIHENLKNMHQSHILWCTLDNQGNPDIETIKNIYLKNEKPKSEPLYDWQPLETHDRSKGFLNILAAENSLLSPSGREFLEKLKAHEEFKKKRESRKNTLFGTVLVLGVIMSVSLVIYQIHFLNADTTNPNTFVSLLPMLPPILLLFWMEKQDGSLQAPNYQEFLFFKHLEQYEQPLELLSRICSDEAISSRIKLFLANTDKSQWNTLFREVFADVLAARTGDLHHYNQMLSFIGQKRKIVAVKP